MALKVNEVSPASEVDIVLNGVATRVVVEVDSKMRAGYIHVRGEVFGMLSLRGSTEITWGRNGKRLRITVTDTRKRAAGGISVRNTGNAKATGGGIANTGIITDSEFRGANTGVVLGGGRTRNAGSQPHGDFSTVKESEVLRQATKPKAQITLVVGPGGLECRITE